MWDVGKEVEGRTNTHSPLEGRLLEQISVTYDHKECCHSVSQVTEFLQCMSVPKIDFSADERESKMLQIQRRKQIKTISLVQSTHMLAHG